MRRVFKCLCLAAAVSFASPAATQMVPLVDHHVHLVSPEAAKSSLPPILPQIEVPAEIKQLLHQRAHHVGDAEAMAELYLDPALVLHPLYPMWVKGQEAIDTVAIHTAKGYRLVPSVYRLDRSGGFVGGTWVMGEGTKGEHVTSFLLSLGRAADGKLKIAAEAFTAKGPPLPRVVTGADIVKELDEAGVKRAVALSLGFQINGGPGESVHSEYARVRAENDWVAAQAGRAPMRLVAFCGINPLKSYAVREVERCAKVPHVRGIKLHLGNAAADWRNHVHLKEIQSVFRAANGGRLSIVAHVKTRRSDFGAADARIILDEVIALAPDVTVQIAHAAGAGPGFDAREAFGAFAEALRVQHPATKNLYFDVASTVTSESSEEELKQIATALRQTGLDRILFGSDRSGENENPKRAWAAFRRLPLTEQELGNVADNVAPYLR